MNEHIPPKYNPYLHIALIPLNSCILISLFVFLLNDISTLDLMTIPITLFLMFGFEWWVHKNILHFLPNSFQLAQNMAFLIRKRLDYHKLSRQLIPIEHLPKPTGPVYFISEGSPQKRDNFLKRLVDKIRKQIYNVISKISNLHLQHHYVFTDKNMQLTGLQQLYLVLMPYWSAISVVFCLIPIFILLFIIFNLNVACLFMITGLGFYIVYEALHLTYHLYTGSNKTLLILQKHHREHHNMLQMNYNFNVTIPLFDKIMKTYLRK